MDKKQRQDIKEAVQLMLQENYIPPEELVLLLEIGSEELIKRFPNRLIEHAEKFNIIPDDYIEGREESGEQEEVETEERE